MRVRRATVDDAGALAVVHVRTWQVAYRDDVPRAYLDALDPAERRQVWQARLAHGRRSVRTLVLHDDADGVIGFVTVSPSRDADTDPLVVGEVNAIYLLPEHWRRGGGAMLMEAGLRRLAGAGFREAILWVLGANAPARRFYEAVGWHADGTVKTDESYGFPLAEVRYRRRDLGSIPLVTGE